MDKYNKILGEFSSRQIYKKVLVLRFLWLNLILTRQMAPLLVLVFAPQQIAFLKCLLKDPYTKLWLVRGKNQIFLVICVQKQVGGGGNKKIWGIYLCFIFEVTKASLRKKKNNNFHQRYISNGDSPLRYKLILIYHQISI